jgi:exported alpha-galactosidase
MNLKAISLLLAAASIAAPAIRAEIVNITTDHNSLVLDAKKDGGLDFLYYGTRLTDAEAAALRDAGIPALDAFPFYGTFPEHESAMAMTHADGNMTMDMAVQGVATAPDGKGTVTTVTMKDRYYPVTVALKYRTFPKDDIIEMWTETTNNEKKNITLRQFASMSLPVRYGDVWLQNYHGAWANEARVNDEPLRPGMKVIKNRDGARNAHTSRGEIMLSLDGKAQEQTGRVIGAAVEYGGNYKLRIDTDESLQHRLFAGMDEENSAYNLKPKETFVTPPVAMTYSADGMGTVSRRFHRWGRENRLANGDKERKILLNSWEGVYFDINEQGMDRMMQDIASMGGELFVMDDGWFGVKYPRKNDSSSLGDWMVDTQKLPNGINGLLESAKKHGVKFGIWIEPEMTNTISEFYEKHPDYVIKAPNRDVVKGRGGTQLVLDMANPKVQDVVFHIVDTLMTKYPDIDYIKWDANAPVMSHGSQYQTADNQSHLYIGYHEGLKKTLERIRAKYPDVTIQLCASGGGRVNWGLLPWFDEFWTSDNTDALQRIYMQWGTSAFFPAIAMGSHISATPNHTTFRTVPIKFRSDVAMSGRLGMEIQPANMSEEDKALCRQAIEDYKKIRPVVQFGDLYRLLSPYDNKGAASLMYVNPEKDDAVFFWWKTDPSYGQKMPRVRMAGLNPDKLYTVTELNRIDNKPLPFEGKQFTGKFLMESGLEIPVSHDVDWHKRMDYSSRVLRLN